MDDGCFYTLWIADSPGTSERYAVRLEKYAVSVCFRLSGVAEAEKSLGFGAEGEIGSVQVSDLPPSGSAGQYKHAPTDRRGG